MTQGKTYGPGAQLPTAENWLLIKIIIPPRKLKSGKKTAKREIYIARDEKTAHKYARRRGQDPKWPKGRAIFTRMEMAQIVDTCRKFPRKLWRKVMLDCINFATIAKLELDPNAKLDGVWSKEDRKKADQRHPPINPEDLKPVSYKLPSTKKKKPEPRKRPGPDTDTKGMPWR